MKHRGLMTVSIALSLALACGSCPSGQECDGGSCVEGDGGLDGGPDGDDAGSDGGGPSFVLGASDRFLLQGTVLTPSGPIEGEVLIEQDRLTCVAAGNACSLLPDAGGATVIDTDGIIAPGVIDARTHAMWAIFDVSDWNPGQFFADHSGWTLNARYAEMVDAQQYLTGAFPSPVDLRCEVVKWAKLRALFSGVTSMVGAPSSVLACYGSLSRLVDTSQNGFGIDTMQVSSVVPSNSTATTVCSRFVSGLVTAYVVDVAEGTSATARNEFATLASRASGCLLDPRTTIAHGSALQAPELVVMADAGMTLAVTPNTDSFLYNQTADVPSALDAGVTVTLASGFPPAGGVAGGSSVLAAARTLQALDPRALFDMMTVNAARATGYQDRIGSLVPGYSADLTVVAGDRSHPYASVVAARPDAIRLTIVGGRLLYGDVALEGAAAAGCEELTVCSAPKFACVGVPDAGSKLNQTFAQIQAALVSGLADYDALVSSSGVAPFSPLAPVVGCD